MVISAARKIGLSPKAIEEAIKDFKGVTHRLELLGKVQGINIFNDSKATNYDSAFVGLQAIKSKTIVVKELWKIILSDNNEDEYESNLMRRVCGLIYFPDKVSGDIKLQVKKEKNN